MAPQSPEQPSSEVCPNSPIYIGEFERLFLSSPISIGEFYLIFSYAVMLILERIFEISSFWREFSSSWRENW